MPSTINTNLKTGIKKLTQTLNYAPPLVPPPVIVSMASPPSKPSPELSSALGSRGMVRRAILSTDPG
ncbi:hypothetical protein COLO4_29869 [Corchorus olitorius]|uniref:Uncharacterized protein n=1 Tax=Corchorus olitorius TaxID=93759 RepID=A0A1R3HCR4_9ROSI|nr:hypothetical protein COLO4_29869 [Corchorus olitorius]